MNLRHETFIREMITHGDRQKAYLAAYPSSTYDAAYNNACRLLAIPAISERIQKAVQEAEEQVAERYREQCAQAAATVLARRVALAAIIRREAVDEKIVTSRGKAYLLRQPPSISDMLKAIELDNELENSWRRDF